MDQKIKIIAVSALIIILIGIGLVFLVDTETEEPDETAVIDDEIQEYELNINVEGEGSTSPEEGVHIYEEGEEVTITATSEEYWEFTEWTGDFPEGEGKQEEIDIIMNESREITAQFTDGEPKNYALTVEIEGEGSVDIDPDQTVYEEGTEVTLTANPASYLGEEWEFKEWTGDHTGTEKETIITITEDKEITAHFTEEPDYYKLTTNIAAGEGTIKINPEQDEYEEKTEITVTATPAEDWKFIAWGREGSAKQCDQYEEICTFTIQENSELGAHFEEDIEISYEISNCQELQDMQYDLSGEFKLINDIDCSDTEDWNDGDGFEPIGRGGNEFTGTLDGQGYEIENLHIDRSGNIGLFGHTDESTIKNIGLKDIDIKGGDGTGSFVGVNNGNIENVYSTGSVEGAGGDGGITGINRGNIENSYTTSSVTTTDPEDVVGGLIGILFIEGSISNSFSDIEATNQDNIIGDDRGEVENSQSLSTEEMMDISTYENAGWSIKEVEKGEKSEEYTWNIVDGKTYPFHP